MSFIRCAFTLFLLLTPSVARASADRLAASDLARLCSSSSDVDYGYCAGYITAIADGILSAGSIGGYSACNHAHVRSQQYIDVFRAYAEIFPGKMNGDAETAVAAALARSFPCPKNQ